MTTIYMLADRTTLALEFLKDKPLDAIYSADDPASIQYIRQLTPAKKGKAYAITELGEIQKETESTDMVQDRMLDVLDMLIHDCKDQSLLVATHPFAFTTVIHFFDETFGYEDYQERLKKKSFLFCMKFDGEICTGIEEIMAV